MELEDDDYDRENDDSSPSPQVTWWGSMTSSAFSELSPLSTPSPDSSPRESDAESIPDSPVPSSLPDSPQSESPPGSPQESARSHSSDGVARSDYSSMASIASDGSGILRDMSASGKSPQGVAHHQEEEESGRLPIAAPQRTEERSAPRQRRASPVPEAEPGTSQSYNPSIQSVTLPIDRENWLDSPLYQSLIDKKDEDIRIPEDADITARAAVEQRRHKKILKERLKQMLQNIDKRRNQVGISRT